MEKLLYFDYCALIILSILIISSLFRHMLHGKVNRVFFALLVLSFFTTAADIWAVALDNLGSGNILGKQIAHTLYLMLHSFATPSYIIYIVAATDTWHIFKKNRATRLLSLTPYAVVFTLLLGNIFIHNLFHFDTNGTYTRGTLFSILYIVAIIYFIVGFAYQLYYRKLFSSKKFSAIIIAFCTMPLATAFQMFYPSILIEMFSGSAGLLYIYLMIQRPEEIIDIDTELQNISSYVNDINRAVLTKKRSRIIMLNITNYETVSKMLGYEKTMEMLHRIATKLRGLDSAMKLHADLYYLGAGKFRLITALDDSDKITQAAEAINTAMKPNISINQMEINLIACVCITNFPDDIGDAESLIAFGSELNSKYYNGNVLYASEIYQQARYEILRDIDSIIEHALTNNEFEVYYQPIYSVAEKRFISAEALLRLRTKDGIFISPDIFIPAAEKSGAIHKIGTFVLEQVCDFISSDAFKKLHLHYIEVNLSVSQCMQRGLAGDILATIEKYEIDPSQLNLEITETAASYSQNTMMDNLNTLSQAGISLSLDDFGTGYSNMMRIASLPLRIVKLDKTFSDVAENSNMSVVLENTIRMIKELNMQIVVEGVETAHLAEKFSNLECEFIQGYYYSKPIPKAELITFLENYESGVSSN